MFPAKVDDDLVNALHACSLPDDNFKTVKGTTLCADDFYEGMLCTLAITHTHTHTRTRARTHTHTHRYICIYMRVFIKRNSKFFQRNEDRCTLH